MLSGLSSLLFGSGGTDDAAVDQTHASQPPSLDTQDTEYGWVLVDVADDGKHPETEAQAAEEPVSYHQAADVGREMERYEQRENQPWRPTGNAVQQAGQAARAVRASSTETQQLKLTRSVQRLQHVAKSKQLSRRQLHMGNKARVVQSGGRKRASARCRVLRPSGQMNGRQPQRNH